MLKPTKEILLAETPSVGWTATWMENMQPRYTTGKHWPSAEQALAACNRIIENKEYYGFH